MRHLKLVTVATLASMALGACQGSKDKFKYRYSVQGCDTGAKTFDDLGSYCEGLKNNQLNNFCAENLRLEAYNKQCSSLTPAGKESDAKNYSYQYEDEAKSCNTGHKSFTDHAKYCEALKNDQENNDCAKEQRIKEFDQQCNSLEADKTDNGTDLAKKSDETPSAQEPTTQPATTQQPSEKQEATEEKEKSDTVTLTSYTESLSVTSKEANDVIVSTVEGKLIVNSIEPKIEKAIQLEQAGSFFFGNGLMESCKLETIKFEAATLDQPLTFTLMGSDHKGKKEDSNCQTQLAQIAKEGFVIEFANVPVAGEGQQPLAKVVLQVKTK